MAKEDARMRQAHRIIEMIETDLENGKVLPPWRKTWAGEHMFPRNIRGNPYRGSNLLMLSLAPYGLPGFMTYNQVLENGGMVNAGEKSWPIIYWKFFDKEDENGKRTSTRPPMCFGSHVFNVEQCSPLSLEAVQKMQKNAESKHGRIRYGAEKNLKSLELAKDSDEATVTVRVQKLVAKWEAMVAKLQAESEGPKNAHNPIRAAERIHAGYKKASGPEVKHGGARACYSPSKDEIRMPNRTTFESAESYHLTRFHEEVHSTGHKSRLDRSELTDMAMFGDHNYSEEELTAEFGAAMLASMAGIANKTEENSAAYIRSWLKRLKDEPSLLYTAASKAQKATDLILGKTFEEKAKAEEAA